MNRATSFLFNAVSLLFLVATVVVIVVVGSIAGDAMDPPILAPATSEPLPTEIMIASPTPRPTWTPSMTPSVTPTPLPTATRTPTITPTGTATLTPTITQTPTITDTPPPSATFTLSPTSTLSPPSLTPSITRTPTPSTTPLPSQEPTGAAAQPTSEYPFIVQPDSLALRENPADNGGCDWQGIAGQVTEPTGIPVVGAQVRVSGPDIEELTTIAGTAPDYGPSGWEIRLADEPVTGSYTVQIYVNNELESPTAEIDFPGSCQQNLATINFVLNRPLD